LGVAFGHCDLQTSPRQTSVRIFQRNSLLEQTSMLGEIKHNIQQTVANTNPDTLRKVVQNTLNSVGVVFQMVVVDNFGICCKAVLSVLRNK
jgi:hypothetical protein